MRYQRVRVTTLTTALSIWQGPHMGVNATALKRSRGNPGAGL